MPNPSSADKANVKRRGPPGPGAYDPKPVHTQTYGDAMRQRSTSPSWAFKSTSKRGLEKQLTTKGEGGDPGALSPNTDRFGGKVAFY